MFPENKTPCSPVPQNPWEGLIIFSIQNFLRNMKIVGARLKYGYETLNPLQGYIQNGHQNIPKYF